MKQGKQKRLANIRLALKLIETMDEHEVAKHIGVTYQTVQSYLAYAETHNIDTDKPIVFRCTCGATEDLVKFQEKWICVRCLNPPYKAHAVDFMGRHTAIHCLDD